MARYLPRELFPLVAVVLLLTCQHTAAQTSSQPPAPPPLVVGPPPKTPEPAPAARELSKEEVAALIENAFGTGSAELKLPVRVWIADLGLAIAAKDSTIALGDGTIRFKSATFAIPAESQMIRGDQIVVTTDRPVKKLTEIGNRRVMRIEVHGTTSIITLTPSDLNGLTSFPSGDAIIVRGANGIRTISNEKVPDAPKKDPRPILPPLDAPTPPAPVPVPAAITPGAFEVVEKGPGSGFDIRFKFKIDPKATQTDLLPTPPKASRLPLWTNEDLAKVPELTFGEPISKELNKHKATETTAHAMAKINHLNLKKTDGFMLALLEQRNDLRGLPFLMGEECRTREDQAKAFAVLVEFVRNAVATEKNRQDGGKATEFLEGIVDIQKFNSGLAKSINLGSSRVTQDQLNRATVAALMQILMPESAQYRLGLAKFLATIPHVDATKALANLAIYSPEDEVRAAAIEGLKLRREKDYTDILIQGFRYPLPAVSKRAAEALVKLERKDLLANLVDVLDSPDPRLPVTQKRDGKDVRFVRELVKVNHHRNCLLCHAPGNTDNTPEGVLKVAVPLPNEPLPKPSEGGYQSTPQTPDIVVRLDMTYLRQDFSLMMPVADAHPWPELQRFDFLVRTRTLTAAEAQAYEACCEIDEPGRLSPYHRSALFALRELTGRDTEPNAAAWRKLLKLAAR